MERVGTFNGIEVYSSEEVPEDEVWFVQLVDPAIGHLLKALKVGETKGNVDGKTRVSKKKRAKA